MAFNNYIKNIVNAVKATNGVTVKGKNANDSINKWQVLQRIRKDAKDWKDAIKIAEQPINPRRVEMQQLYNETVNNGHVYACMEKRKNQVLKKKFFLSTPDGKVNEEWTNYFNTEWNHTFASYALDAIFYGYQLINVKEIVASQITDIGIVKRHHILPDKELIAHNLYSNTGEPFLEGDIAKWTIWCTTPSENGISNVGYGLLYRCAIYEIFIRNTLGYNGDFVELFSQPMRIGSTSKIGKDRDDYEEALKAMGSTNYLLKDPMDELVLLESKLGGTGWQGYHNLESRMEKIISKVLCGHSDALDSTPGKLGGSDEKDKALSFIESRDCNWLRNIYNAKFIPMLRNIGIMIPNELSFNYSNEDEQQEEDKAKDEGNKLFSEIILNLKNAGYSVDPADITEKTGLRVTKEEVQEPKPGFGQDIVNKLSDMYNDQL